MEHDVMPLCCAFGYLIYALKKKKKKSKKKNQWGIKKEEEGGRKRGRHWRH